MSLVGLVLAQTPCVKLRSNARKTKQEQGECRHRPRFLDRKLMKVKPLSANRISANHRSRTFVVLACKGYYAPGGRSVRIRIFQRDRISGHNALAERAGMSKQAMNQLLRSLEGLGYIVRSDAPNEGRGRIIRFTKRGHTAYAKIHDLLRDIEREWIAELGPKDFAHLKALLCRVWESPLIR